MNKPIRPLHKNHAASRPWRQICLAGIGATCAIALPAGTFAALFYWTGDHDANWSTTTAPAGTNWSSSPDFNADPNGVPGAADSVVFALPNAVNLNTVLGADFSIKSLAFTGDLLPATPVTIGGTNTLTLGTGGMTSNTNAPVTLSTKVALGGSQIWVNGSTAQPLTVSGVISGGFGNNLALTGPGAFTFTGANTYTGSTTLSAGTTLTLSGPSGSLLGSLGITLAGGTLTLDNTAGASNTRLINSAIVTSSGGTLNLLGASGSTPSNQTVGTLVLGSGATSVNVLQSIGNTAALTFGSASVTSISRPITPGSAGKAASPGGTVNFSPNATGSIFLPNVGLANGIIGGWATIGAIDNSGALDFATVNGSGKVIPLAAYAGTLTAGATANVQLAAPAAMGGNQSINSLYLTGSGAVTFASGNTLTIGSGGIISNGATGTIAAGNNQPAITNVATLGATDSANTGAITTASGGDLIITTSSNLQINALLTGNVALTKSGAGLLDLSHQNAAVPIANSYTGITTINAGVIKVNSDSNLGAAPGTFTANALTLNGGELRVATAFALASNRGITVGPQGGTLSYTDGSLWTLSQAITGTGGVTIFADLASNTTAGLNSIIRLANASPSPTNDYQGATLLKTSVLSGGAVARGVIQWGADNQIPDGSAVTVSGDAGTVIDLNGHNDTFGSLAGSTNIQGLTGSLKVGGNNQSTTYSGVLGAAPIVINAGSGQTSNTASTGSVEKTGSGTWTLTGTNAYTGATTISGGTLLIGSGTATTSSASLASATVNVNTGALGGNGTIAGAVSVGAAGQLAPAMSSTTTNTLTIGSNLTISGSTLNFNFGAAPASIGLGAVGTSDLILLPGATSVLTIGSTVTLNISAVSPGFGVGAYKLIDASANSAMFANTATFTIHGATNFTYTIVSSGGALDPAVGGGTVPLGDLYLQVLQGSPTLTWTGNTNANWDTVSANWTSASAGNIYANGSNAVFDDTAGGSSNIAVDGGGVSPSSIIFNNATRSYIFGGGAITVTSASGITKNQAGTVTFNTNVTTPVTTIANGSVIVSAGQTYTSSTAVNINGGSLSVSGTLNTPTLNDATNGALFVSQTGSLNNNIALTVNGTATFNNAAQTIGGITGTGTVILNGTTLGFVSDNAFAGTITGTGGITVAGGNVTLSNGGNTYNGATTISGGTLRVTNTTGSATGTSAVTVQNGGTLAGAGIITGPVNINAGGILQSNGTLSGSVTLGGTLSPAGDGTVGKITLGSLLVNDGAAFNFDLAAIGASDNGTLTGALTLLGAETLKLNLLAGTMVGDYPLFTAAGGITDNATFTIQPSGAGNVAGATYTVLKVGNQLVLRLGVPTITWTGATSNNWDFVDANWTTNPYSDASQVTFNDSGANTTININAPVAPLGGLIFSNSLINYTLAGKPIGGGGGLTLNGSGTVTIGAGNTFTGASAINAGTLSIAADSSLGAAPAAPMPAALTIAAGATLAVTPGSASFVLNGNRGLAVGGASGSGATISVPTGTTLTYTGAIANITGQQGILTKSGAGELDLAGTSTFSGGLNVNGGAVRLSGATSAGTGAISVSNATLDLGAGVSNPTITLGAGSTLGVFGAAQTYGGNLLVTGAATVDAFDPITAATPLDVILTGMLQGSGNLTIGNQNSTTPDRAGVQLHGPPSAGINAYSGNIIVLNSSKLELQTAAASGSVAGNGTIVLNVGATDPLTNAGTFSLLNLRNNFAGNTSFGNNVQLTGSNGAAYLNLVGTAPAGSTVNMGNLSIGDTQALGAVSATATLPYTVAFSSVTLTGGNATFTPQPVGNTTYVAAESIRLGPISENAPGSGITMNGAATLTLAAVNTYSGTTKIQSGTVIVAVPGALPAASALIVNGGKLDLNNGLSSNDQTVASLAGTNGTITNSDATNPHTLIVDQASAGGPTSFSGSISGNLALTKSGNGTLQLLGVESPALGTTVNGGTLSIQATLNGAATVGGTGTLNVGSDALHGTVNGAITVASGGTLNGFGTTRAVTVQGGGFLSPGNAAGIMTINGNLDLSAPTSHLTLQLGGTVVSPNPTYDLLEQSSGTIKLGGEVGISFINSGSYTPAIGDTFYVIVNLPGQAVSGAFANDLGGVITDTAGDTFAVSYSANFFNPANSTTDGAAGFAPGQGHDVALQVLTVIPEPGSLATALSGLGVLLGLGRFRRRR